MAKDEIKRPLLRQILIDFMGDERFDDEACDKLALEFLKHGYIAIARQLQRRR